MLLDGGMELVATAGSRPAAFGSAWLWAPVFGIGLAAVLAGPLPPGGVTDLARPAALRLLAGEFALGWTELAALALVAGWMLAKPLCVVGAILLLEFRFSAGAAPKDHLFAWAGQTISLGFFIGLATLFSLLDLFPQPLIRVGEAGGTAALLLLSVPAFLISLLIADLFGYWVHRAMHRFAWLWRFHALHHSFEIDVLRSFGHPVDHVLSILFIGVPTALLIGTSQEQLYLIVALTSLQAQITHTRLPIHFGPLGGRLLCDNRYHFIHHSLDPAHYNKNFADRFPVLDMLFGTYAAPGDGLVATGLPDRTPPRTLGQYLTVRLPERVSEAQAR